jgi:DNA-binding protein HU-beta
VAATVIDGTFEVILATVAKGEDGALIGFAKFSKVKRPARMPRNPATGEAVKVKAKTVAKITPLKGFQGCRAGRRAGPEADQAEGDHREEGGRRRDATQDRRRGSPEDDHSVTHGDPQGERVPAGTSDDALLVAEPVQEPIGCDVGGGLHPRWDCTCLRSGSAEPTVSVVCKKTIQ